MSTGRLVAADPTWLADQAPFTVEVAPGTYPVTLSVARWLRDPSTPSTQWALLVDRGQRHWRIPAAEEIRGLPPGDRFSWGFVDSLIISSRPGRLTGS